MVFRARRIWPFHIPGHKKQDSANQLNPDFVLGTLLKAKYHTE
jgi:hypothetical protein